MTLKCDFYAAPQVQNAFYCIIPFRILISSRVSKNTFNITAGIFSESSFQCKHRTKRQFITQYHAIKIRSNVYFPLFKKFIKLI